MRFSFFVLLFLCVSNTPAADSAVKRDIVKRIAPSVVHIESQSYKPMGHSGPLAGRIGKVEETGSGVLIELAGKTYVLSNCHIVTGVESDAIRIHLADRQILKPVKILSSADFDVALLEVSAENLVPAKIGNSDMMEVPDEILAFGSPFGLSGSVSTGVLSAKGRRKIPQGNQAVPIQSFFQTDAAVNPGNSGGPMVNLDGEVVGMITAIASGSGGSEGVAFAIPINSVMRSAKQLVRTGTVARPYLGIELDPKYDGAAAEKAGLDRRIGARIERVSQDSPGAKAGLLSGDIVLSYNETTVEDDLHLVILIAESEVGQSPKLRILRGSENRLVSPRLAER